MPAMYFVIPSKRSVAREALRLRRGAMERLADQLQPRMHFAGASACRTRAAPVEMLERRVLFSAVIARRVSSGFEPLRSVPAVQVFQSEV